MKKLNFFIKKDSRIKKVYNYAKKKYIKANNFQHNWEHIIRDLYRALIIAETEKNVNYGILVPAVILHDIGATEDIYENHVKKGVEIVNRDLAKLGYNKEEIKQIAYGVGCHRGKPKPSTIESKILFDADRLEKSGICGVFAGYRAQLELGKSIIEWAYPRHYKNKDFFTKKAREISKKGFEEMDKHFREVQKSLKKRKDWTTIEKDLW
jgi:uncharacterized protein